MSTEDDTPACPYVCYRHLSWQGGGSDGPVTDTALVECTRPKGHLGQHNSWKHPRALPGKWAGGWHEMP